jgi:hypothetical protein
VLPDRAVPVAALLPDLPRPVVLVGEGASVYRQTLSSALGKDARFAPETAGRPSAAAVALLGRDAIRRGDGCDLAATEPTYLRRSQAEQARTAAMAARGNG